MHARNYLVSHLPPHATFTISKFAVPSITLVVFLSVSMCVPSEALIYPIRRLNIDDSRESFFDFSHDDVIVLLDLCRWGLGVLNSIKPKK